MKMELGEKCSVAWFKLAEFVGRKEKERALAVYRLLAYSLSDAAFIAQLEGDLLLAFADVKAFELYDKAARLYERNGQSAHALHLDAKIAYHKRQLKVL